MDIYTDTQRGEVIYPEHDNDYYQECIDNLKSKGIEIGGN